MTVPLEHQIQEVERELSLRANVYPGLIAKRKLKRPQAEEHMARMRGVLRTLEWLHGNEALQRGMPRPADLIAALAHIRRNVAGSQPGSLGEHITKVIDDVLSGIQVPLLQELAIAAAKVLEPPALEEKGA